MENNNIYKRLTPVFKEKIPIYKKMPVLFCQEILQFEPDIWQAKALNDLAVYPKVSIRSGQGVGKTGLEACALLWFLSCFPNARVVATAPTRQQLNDVLWAEISKWQAKSPILKRILRWTKTRIYMSGREERWFAAARTATKPENMQGFHEDNMLFIVDEASGVADPIMEAILGTLTGDNNKLLMCGNPTRTTGVFYDSHHADRAIYRAHVISSLDSARTNKENIESLIRKYGKDSNVVRVRVYGEFPESEDDVFIALHLIENSIKTKYVERPVKEIIVACDVARYGNDKTIIGFKVNEKAEFYKKINGQDLMTTASELMICTEKLIKKFDFRRKVPIRVDDSGLGGGVTDRLRQMKKTYPERYKQIEIVPIMFGQRVSEEEDQYNYDTTTQMAAQTKALLNPFDEKGLPKEVQLILPNDPELVSQLSTRKYEITENAKMKLESKDKMKARGLDSPDEADCIFMLCIPYVQTASTPQISNTLLNKSYWRN